MEKSQLVCRFFLSNSCNKGNDCNFLHEKPETEIKIPCIFFKKGCCFKGDDCNFSHEQAPSNRIENQESVEASKSIECNICFEVVMEQENKTFGLLENCSHSFCISCIRKWRNQDGLETNLKCPICREKSHFVIPSELYLKPGDEKKQVEKEYKENLAKLPCKYFKFGEGSCKFGNNCFYAHCNSKGEEITVKPKKKFTRRRNTTSVQEISSILEVLDLDFNDLQLLLSEESSMWADDDDLFFGSYPDFYDSDELSDSSSTHCESEEDFSSGFSSDEYSFSEDSSSY